MHSAVEIVLKDGSRYNSGIVEREADRFSEKDLERKFRRLVAYVAKPALVDRLVEMVWNFDQVPDVCELTDLVSNNPSH